MFKISKDATIVYLFVIFEVILKNNNIYINLEQITIFKFC